MTSCGSCAEISAQAARAEPHIRPSPLRQKLRRGSTLAVKTAVFVMTSKIGRYRKTEKNKIQIDLFRDKEAS